MANILSSRGIRMQAYEWIHMALVLAMVVRRLDNTTHWINCSPANNNCWQNKLRYPLDSNLSRG